MIDVLPQNTFFNIYNTANIKVKGLFKFLSVTGRWLYQLSYKKEALYSFGLIQSKESKNVQGNNRARVNSDCTDWYLVTTYYYDDGSTYQTSEYVGTTCSGCSDPNLASLCPDDGGGSGGGGGGEGDYEFATSPKLVDWRVVEHEGGLWYVKSTEKLFGVKSSGRPARFTGISHESDMIHAHNWNWQRSGVVVSYVSSSASCTISGQITTYMGSILHVPPTTINFSPSVFN